MVREFTSAPCSHSVESACTMGTRPCGNELAGLCVTWQDPGRLAHAQAFGNMVNIPHGKDPYESYQLSSIFILICQSLRIFLPFLLSARILIRRYRSPERLLRRDVLTLALCALAPCPCWGLGFFVWGLALALPLTPI